MGTKLQKNGDQTPYERHPTTIIAMPSKAIPAPIQSKTDNFNELSKYAGCVHSGKIDIAAFALTGSVNTGSTYSIVYSLCQEVKIR